MMEKNLNPIDPAVAPRSIRWRQVLAAILLCSPFLISTVLGFLWQPLYQAGWTEVQIALLHSLGMIIPQLAAFLLLIGIAANRPTRVAVEIAAGWLIFTLVLDVLGPMLAFLETSGDLISLIDSLIDSLVFIYLFSILLRNNKIAESRRKWIIMLPVSHIYGVFYTCACMAQNRADALDWLCRRFSPVNVNHCFYYLEHVFFSSDFLWFQYIMQLLLCIAWFKLTHSEAFAPTYDDTPAPAGAYSPATKYMAMPIVCGLLCIATCLSLYHFF